jgi:phage terminase small subunit
MNKDQNIPLTPRQMRFCEEYIIDNNDRQAAIRAGYNVKSAKQQGWRLLTYTNVKAYIAKLQDQIRKDNAISIKYVMDNLKSVAERCLQIEPVLDKTGKMTGTYRFDQAGANRALELMGKQIGMFVQRVEDVTPVDKYAIADRLQRLEALRIAATTGTIYHPPEPEQPAPEQPGNPQEPN